VPPRRADFSASPRARRERRCNDVKHLDVPGPGFFSISYPLSLLLVISSLNSITVEKDYKKRDTGQDFVVNIDIFLPDCRGGAGGNGRRASGAAAAYRTARAVFSEVIPATRARTMQGLSFAGEFGIEPRPIRVHSAGGKSGIVTRLGNSTGRAARVSRMGCSHVAGEPRTQMPIERRA
jgi:hypothetical protein